MHDLAPVHCWTGDEVGGGRDPCLGRDGRSPTRGQASAASSEKLRAEGWAGSVLGKTHRTDSSEADEEARAIRSALRAIALHERGGGDCHIDSALQDLVWVEP